MSQAVPEWYVHFGDKKVEIEHRGSRRYEVYASMPLGGIESSSYTHIAMSIMRLVGVEGQHVITTSSSYTAPATNAHNSCPDKIYLTVSNHKFVDREGSALLKFTAFRVCFGGVDAARVVPSVMKQSWLRKQFGTEISVPSLFTYKLMSIVLHHHGRDSTRGLRTRNALNNQNLDAIFAFDPYCVLLLSKTGKHTSALRRLPVELFREILAMLDPF